MPSEIVLLLTGTVNVGNKHFTALMDAGQRKNDYISTIKYYLENYPYPVVFVENSGEDLSGSFQEEIKADRLEILTFSGNDYPPEMGKGLGEMRCLGHAVSQSKVINEQTFVFKITGRYRILNLKNFIGDYTDHPETELIADLTNHFKLSASGIFGFRTFFANRYLLPLEALLNDSKKVYFEHVLAKAVLSAIAGGVNFRLLRNYPRVSAVSGTTGKSYNTSIFYYFPRNLKYIIRYFIINR